MVGRNMSKFEMSGQSTLFGEEFLFECMCTFKALRH
jgi:hypothetical protein